MARIDLIDVCKTLTDQGTKSASTFSMQGLNLRIPDGKTLVVLGPSGCGKTTLLKIIAGLIPPDSGEVRSNGVEVTTLSPRDRRIGMVFQNYALYPHLSSRRNVLAYFFFRKKTPELDAMAKAKYQRTSELMGVELEYLLDRRPSTLSGGEKQRVALGRCITRDAELFLVDEPFASLDQALREKYRVNLKVLLRQFSITTVYVTHDHHEALILADQIAVMGRGRIEQVGTPMEIYDTPENLFVAGFLNLHAGTPPLSLVPARCLPAGAPLGDAWVGVRPEDVDISKASRDGGVRGRVTEVVRFPAGNSTHVTIRVAEHEVHALLSSGESPPVGEEAWLTFRRYHLFERE